MCLAVPAKLLSASEGEGCVDLHGSRVDVSLALVPEAQPGDWLLVHAGFAIQRLSDEDAQATWAVLRDVASAQERAAP